MLHVTFGRNHNVEKSTLVALCLDYQPVNANGGIKSQHPNEKSTELNTINHGTAGCHKVTQVFRKSKSSKIAL